MIDDETDADGRRGRSVRRWMRRTSVALAVVALAAAVGVTCGARSTDHEDRYDTVDGVRVSRALGAASLTELRRRMDQGYVSMSFTDPTAGCGSYQCLYAVDVMDAEEAFESGYTSCRPYYQWICATDAYHRATSRTIS